MMFYCYNLFSWHCKKYEKDGAGDKNNIARKREKRQ